MNAGQVCTRRVITADPNETVGEVARRMRESHVGDVVIADSQNRPVGIVTDRDIVVSAVAQSPDKVGTLVAGEVMSRDVITVRATEDIDAALRKMQKHGIRRLPVVGTDGRLEGILTLDDLLEVMSNEFTELINLVALEQKRERVVRPSVPPVAAAAGGAGRK
jgi:CBS domain-containing protein